MKDQVTNCREKGIHAVFLGSAQPDKSLEDHALSLESSESIVFVTPEWISKSPNKDKVQQLVTENILSLIACDRWGSFISHVATIQDFLPRVRNTEVLAENRVDQGNLQLVIGCTISIYLQ